MSKKQNPEIKTLKKGSNPVLARRSPVAANRNNRRENFSLITNATVKTPDDVITGKAGMEEEGDKV